MLKMRERMVSQRAWELSEDTNNTWSEALDIIRCVAREVLGSSKDRRQPWRWNEKVMKRVRAKQETYAKLMSINEANRTLYNIKKKEAKKKSITVVMTKAFEKILDTKGGEKSLFKLSKAREEYKRTRSNEVHK